VLLEKVPLVISRQILQVLVQALPKLPDATHKDVAL